MKNFIKEWLLPPKISAILSSQISLYKTKKLDLNIIKKNSVLKNIHKGERCFILGNAPSIKDIDIKLLKNEHVFVMSTFYNHPDFNNLKPKYHSCVRIYNNDKNIIKILKSLSDNVLSESVIFLDLFHKKIVKDNELFINNEVYYISTAIVNRKYNISKITKNYRTNPLQALEIAIYMGFKNIYLHGLDLNEACTQNYKYGFKNNLVVKDYNNDVNKLSVRKQSEIFYNASFTYKEFEDYMKYAKVHNINIINLNEKGMLNMFTRKKLKEIL